jgi:uncharacterized DUF497 family protein
MLKFEWNERKNIINKQKHGIRFEEAQTIWSDKNAVEFIDTLHSDFEERFIRIGWSTFNNLLLVVHCEREKGNIIRIISARKIKDKERRVYERGI